MVARPNAQILFTESGDSYQVAERMTCAAHPADRQRSPAALRARAVTLRQYARTFATDEFGERLLAFAAEMDRLAEEIEAGIQPPG
jgi:hypothetical protein